MIKNAYKILTIERLENEYWKLIPNLPSYQISSYGRIKNINTNKIRKPNLNYGYVVISLKNSEKQISCRVHRLVAQAFDKNFTTECEVDHIDRIKTNNHISNLRCVDNKENQKNKRRVNRQTMINIIKEATNKYSLITIKELISHLETNEFTNI